MGNRKEKKQKTIMELGSGPALVLLGVLILLSVTLVRGALRFAHQVIFESCSQGVLYDMRDKFFRRLLLEDLNFFNHKRLVT